MENAGLENAGKGVLELDGLARISWKTSVLFLLPISLLRHTVLLH